MVDQKKLNLILVISHNFITIPFLVITSLNWKVQAVAENLNSRI